MWKVVLETKGYNRICFQIENLTDAAMFLELAQKYCKVRLEITIEKEYETEEEEEE